MVGGVLISVTNKSTAVQKLTIVALLGGVRERRAERGEHFVEWDVIAHVRLPGGDARRYRIVGEEGRVVLCELADCQIGQLAWGAVLFAWGLVREVPAVVPRKRECGRPDDGGARSGEGRWLVVLLLGGLIVVRRR